MCIIGIKYAGVKLPSKKTLGLCATANPHGAGFMCIADGAVKIRKGYNSLDEIFNAVKRIPDSEPAVLHFRIASKGAICQELCHPFPVTDDLEKMRKLEAICDIGVAHNGTIQDLGVADDTSDTMAFIQKYMNPKELRSLIVAESKPYMELLSRASSGSRMAIMLSSGQIWRLGNWERDDSGMYWSNSGYLAPEPYEKDWWKKKRDGSGFDWTSDHSKKRAPDECPRCERKGVQVKKLGFPMYNCRHCDTTWMKRT
jgi:hypothetical protein